MTYLPPNAGGLVPSRFLQRSGRQLILNGSPFRFVGANAYNIANDPAIYQQAGARNTFSNPATGLADAFQRMRDECGATVVRFWAFQSYATNGSNARDWSALDRVFAAANTAGVKVIPTLENHFGDLTRYGNKDATWYATGYQSPYGSPAYPTSLRQWATDIAARYANEPSIAYWCIMNEPETPSASAFLAFVTDIAGRIKAADPNHLVGIGVQGKDEDGNRGTDYYDLHNLSTVDICTTHDYRNNRYAISGELPVSGWFARGLSVQGASGSINYGNYNNYEKFPLPAKRWIEVRGTLIAGSGAVGLYMHGDPSAIGDVYVGQIAVGPHDAPTQTITFEDGTIKGALQDGSGTLSNSATVALPGRTRSLKLTASSNFDGNVLLPISAADGSEFCVWVYADVALALTAPGSGFAGRFMQSRTLNKPIVIEEYGAEVGTNFDTVPVVPSVAARALIYDRKLAGYYGAGAAGALVWDWENATRSPLDWCLTTGDPACDVLRRYAATLLQSSAGNQPPTAVATAYATLPYEGADDSANYAALKAAGADTYILSVQWAQTEATKGTYDFAALVTKRNALIAAGMNVVLGLHSHYFPAWVHTDAATNTASRHKNQTGAVVTGTDQSANCVFSQQIRDRIALWVAAAAAALGTTGWAAIRPPALVYGEWSYPHVVTNNDYWAYDSFAQATSAVTGRVATSRIPLCPVPGWTPGTGTAAQAGQFADWYIDALTDTMRWSCETVAANFPGTIPILMLHPSFGTRDTQYADAKAARLDGTSTQAAEVRAGVVWERSIPAICASPGGGVALSRVAHGSSWADCPYSGTSGGYNATRDPYGTVTALAAANGGTKFYAETTGGADKPYIVRMFERLRRRRPLMVTMAFTGQYTGSGNAGALANLQDAIALDTLYGTVAVDAAILWHAINIHAAQRKADQWGVRLLIGEHGVKNDGTWNTLFDRTYTLFDDHNDRVTAWASFLDTSNPLAIYKASSSGFKTDTATTLATVVEAHPDTTAHRRGVNLSGAEGGFDRNATTANSMSSFNPGVRGTDYAYPASADIAYLAGRGVKVARLPFVAERLFIDQTGATFRTAEQTALGAVLDACATNGIAVILDMHNYGRFRSAPDAATAVTINLLGAGWTAAQHNAMWVAIANWLAGGATSRANAVLGYSHNEPYNLGSTTGAFTPTVSDTFDSTVQGWSVGGAGGAASWQAGGFLRVTRTMGATVNSTETIQVERGNFGGNNGGEFRAALKRIDSNGGTATARLQYQTVSYGAVDLGGASGAIGTGASTDLSGSGTVPTDARNQFIQIAIANPVAGATYTFDIDYWRQGSSAGGGSNHETAFASWVAAVQAVDSVRTVYVPAAEYSSLSGFPQNHPSGTAFFPVNARTVLELHSYYDRDMSGTYTNSYASERDYFGGYA